MKPASARARLTITPYLFLLPALLVTAAVILLPVAQTAWMSLFDYVLFRPRNIPFLGIGNFIRAFNDPVFWVSLWNSVVWIGAVVFFQFILGLGTALLLNQSFWWRSAARALIVVPWALPSVIIGLMWTWMYDFNLGIFNDVLLRLGVIGEPIAWLARTDTTLPAVILALVWQGFPFFAVVILAGLQTVPSELLEAAEIDGARPFQRLRHVTMPAIMEVVATALLLRTIWVANSLDVILVMTGGGPGYVTHTLPLYAFLKASSAMEYGYAAALALILTALLLVVVFAYVRRAAKDLEI
ncbi:carbohydrate ABC transporter membrane protein 1, CUT1 family (TC 3.A.1.1.-) [Devosia enhydra]|uniref:Carbohydrate ABC transporter membrane protein 1, CUT1 family (TC 3.A.1.1.-) n=1 Tax=Devosia enhydra TaxID=665118 RepID=A0A1K2I407_9HYPH|nr:sugar ABC transporter permease [Devosia enhydra]SFZ86468.1 carbohydrate ABC transporter membrane protein 1, CUT1 family (TC 3.A.1.1.-) [Devosia enhydra]